MMGGGEKQRAHQRTLIWPDHPPTGESNHNMEGKDGNKGGGRETRFHPRTEKGIGHRPDGPIKGGATTSLSMPTHESRAVGRPCMDGENDHNQTKFEIQKYKNNYIDKHERDYKS